MPTKIPAGLKDRVARGKSRRAQVTQLAELIANKTEDTNGKANGAGERANLIRNLFAGGLGLNVLTTRSELLEKLFDDRRDIDVECGYPKSVTPQQYRYLYDREGIATRVVAIYPEQCWQKPPNVFETEDAGKTIWEATFDQLEEEHNLLHYLARVDEVSGIGTFGILLLGIDDGKPLDQPVDGIILEGRDAGRKVGFQETSATGESKETGEGEKTPQKGDGGLETGEEGDKPEPTVAEPVQTTRSLLYLRALDESLASIAEYESDETSRRYGMPKYYNVKLVDPTAVGNSTALGADSTEKRVHWTRIIHIADNCKSNEVFGTPRMQPVYNRLYDLRKLLGGSAEMFWKGAFPGFSFEVNPDLGDVELDNDAMRAEFAAYANGLQRYLALTGVSAKSLAVQVASPMDHVMVQLKAISITIKCPIRILMGAEAGQLASTQDQENWNEQLAHRQLTYVTPKIVRATIDHLIAIDVLPEPQSGEYHVEWPDLNTDTDEQRAKVADLIVKAIATYIQSGADVLIPPFEFLTIIMGMESEQAEAIIEAAGKHVEEEEDKELEKRARLEEKGLPVPLTEGEMFEAQLAAGGDEEDEEEDGEEDED